MNFNKIDKASIILLAASIGYFLTWKVNLSLRLALVGYSFLLVLAGLMWLVIQTSLVSEEDKPRAKAGFIKLMYLFYMPYVLGSVCSIAITYLFITYWL